MNRFAPALVCAAVLAACATPQMPSGGPPDTTPPEIIESTPAPGSVNVSEPTVRITFSEYVDESSFGRALSISPAPVSPPEISWGRRSVEIRLGEALGANTTYVVTLDTELRDIRGAALTAPIMFAFSSGPTVSAGTLAGRVVLPDSASPAAAADVFAYTLLDSTAPDSLPDRPAYRTQTDASGAFAFDYLTEQYYFVAALQDQNRNLYPDAEEAFAPPPVPALFADSVAAPLEQPWVLTRVDTTHPFPVAVQSLSASRHALRLSEPVRFVERDPSAWQLSDSTSGAAVDVLDLYIRQEDERLVIVETPALEPEPHILRSTALVDTAGNPVLEQTVTFRPSTAEDTLQHRFLSFLPADLPGPDYTLARGVEPGLRFNAPIDEAALGSAVAVLDSMGTPLSYAAVTGDGTNYRLMPELWPGASNPIQVHVDDSAFAGSDSVHRATYERIPASETGELAGIVARSGGAVFVQAAPVDAAVAVPSFEAAADSTGAFQFDGLPAGTYRIRAFVDEDGDGAWSGGLLQPYVRPEPIAWLPEPVRVRARWETSLPDTLQIRASDQPETP
jgi:hypothetical protein